MKVFCTAVLLGLLCFGCAEAQSVADQLQAMITKTASDSASDRIYGFEQLSKYWDRRGRTALAGFSDIPVKAAELERKSPVTNQELDAIATAITVGIGDANPDVRKAAAIAICAAPRSSKTVVAAVDACLKSVDATVVWYGSLQADRTPPKFASVIESLIVNLASEEFSKHYSASRQIGSYGSQARAYSKRIVDVAVASKPADRYSRLYVLHDIGLTDQAADALADAAVKFTDRDLSIAAICLLDFPEKLKLLKRARPELIASLESHRARLFPFLCEHQYEPNATREWLSSAENLPANIMGMLRERRFINEIAKHERDASEHEVTFLKACKRACGANAEETIDVDSSHPVKFRPASAWPKSDERRKSKNARGHGDGGTSVMVTGEIRGADGTHPDSVAFFRTNDGMLMGNKRNSAESVLYDKQNGRFVFLTSVFAAYSMGEGQAEPGPYQTGSAQIRIEAPGHKPINVQFFDEIPDLRITLDKESDSPEK